MHKASYPMTAEEHGFPIGFVHAEHCERFLGSAYY